MNRPRHTAVVALLGTTQTLAWASSYYLPALLAPPPAWPRWAWRRPSGRSGPPVLFGLAMAHWGGHALWLTAGLGVLALGLLQGLALRMGRWT